MTTCSSSLPSRKYTKGNDSVLEDQSGGLAVVVVVAEAGRTGHGLFSDSGCSLISLGRKDRTDWEGVPEWWVLKKPRGALLPANCLIQPCQPCCTMIMRFSRIFIIVAEESDMATEFIMTCSRWNHRSSNSEEETKKKKKPKTASAPVPPVHSAHCRRGGTKRVE